MHSYAWHRIEIPPLQASLNTHRYTGQERDVETENDYMHFRYYSPGLGRFMRPDNVNGNMTNPQSWNLYSYVHGNPVNFNDPTGHMPPSAGQLLKYLLGFGPGHSDDGTTTYASVPISPLAHAMWVDAAIAAAIAQTQTATALAARTGSFWGDFPLATDPRYMKQPVAGPTAIPLAPPGVSVDRNIAVAEAHKGSPFKYAWFYLTVRNRGPWDYKQQGRQYQEFGNFNYGATGAAAGIPEEILLRAAGAAQVRAGTSTPAWGVPLGPPPYGDDPEDQIQIKAGENYYYNNYLPQVMHIQLGGIPSLNGVF